MSFQESIKKLKGVDISTIELQTCINTIYAQKPFSDSDSLLLSSILLEKIIPQTYLLLDTQTKNTINELLSSKVPLIQIIKLIKNGSENSIKVENMYLYIDIFLKIIQQNLSILFDNLINSKNSDTDKWYSLLTFITLDCLGLIIIWLMDHIIPSNIPLIIDRNRVINVADSYVYNFSKIIFNKIETVPIEKIQFLRQCLIIFLEKEPNTVFDIILDNWNQCIQLFINIETQNRKQKYQALESKKKFLLAIFTSMNKRVTSNNVHLYKKLINSLNVEINDEEIRKQILNKCSINENILVSFIWIQNLKINSIFVNSCLETFGNNAYILNTSIIKQKIYAQFLILILTKLSNDDLIDISTNPVFLDTVTTRLESRSLISRELGMFVADYIYKRINNKNMFNITEYSKKREEFMKPLFVLNTNDDSDKTIDEIIQLIKTVLITKDSANNTALSNNESMEIIESRPIMIDMNYDSDNDDSDLEDNTIGRKPTITKPVFLKDLLHYLTTDPEKDKTTYEKRGIAFSIGIEMIRLKKNTPELQYYSIKLIDAILNLDMIGFPIKENEKYTEDQIKVAFDSWKLSFLIGICVSEYEQVFKYLIESFLNNDWTVPTRIQILTCIGLSCRELCGKDDEFIWGKDNLEKVEQKQLNGPGHFEFLKLDNKQEKMTQKIITADSDNKEKTLIDALEKVGINDGKIIRKSRKLEIDKENQLNKGKTRDTKFINKQLPKLYFSLVAIWQEVNSLTFGAGFKVGIMSEYLNAHYLDILSMIYACGIPVCIELIEMSMEQISIITGQLRSILMFEEEEFPILLFSSVVKSLRLLLTDNDTILSILQSSAGMEINILFESYAQVLANSPSLEEPTQTLGLILLEQLRKYSFLYA
jgi:hypothetical protein